MKKNNYNIDDEQFKEVIESLKQLPRVDAPVDFEMNLRRKLNNMHYQQTEKKGFFYYFNLKRPLIPAAAALACAIVAFIFISRQPEVEKPFTKIPSVNTQVQKEPDKDLQRKNIQKDPANISSSDVAAKKGTSKIKQSPVQHETINPQREESDQIASGGRGIRRLRDLDFGGFGNDLDKSLRAKPDPNGGEMDENNPGSNVNFGGFNLVPGADSERDLLRARMDSLKKLWLRGNR